MSHIVNVDIQVIPITSNDIYPIVDRAIEVIQASGLKYDIGPSGTTLEGPLDDCLQVAKAAHQAGFVDGVQRVVTIVKIEDAVGGSSIDSKIAKYRT